MWTFWLQAKERYFYTSVPSYKRGPRQLCPQASQLEASKKKLRIRETIGIKWEAARKELRKNSGKEHIEYTEKETGKE